MLPNVAIGVENIMFGVLFLALDLMLVTGRMHMNRWSGFRFHKTYESQATWKHVNRYGGYRLIGWSTAMQGVSVLALFRPYKDNVLLVTALSFAPLLAIIRVVSESRKYVGILSDSQPGQEDKAKD